MRVDDLGDTELVTASSTSHRRASAHILALENRVDDLETENRLLKDRLSAKPSAVTQEAYDDLCRRYQMEVNSNLPF